MNRIIFTETFDDFAGAGLAADPAAGQLDSDIWTVSGFSSPEDDARGLSDGAGETTGGLYAVERSDGDRGLLIQPGGSDFTPGTLTARIDAGDTDLSGVTLSFDRLVLNDQTRANSFDVSYSLDGVSFVTLDSFVSDEIAGTEGLTSERVTVSLPDLAAGSDLYLRWTGDDVSGAGARDEFGLDNIVVEGTEGAAAPVSVVINEILGSTTGLPDSEYVELFGTPGASLAGLSFVQIDANADQAGAIDYRIDFADDAVLGDNGYLLVANETAQGTYGVTANLALEGALENGPATYALVETASLSGETVTGAEVVRDAVAITGGEADGVFYYDAPVVGPDGTFLPAGVGRTAEGVDTDTAADFRILSFNNASPPNTPTAGTGLGGDAGGDTGGGVSIDDAPTLVSAVQGAGAQSPLLGQEVVIEAIVSGDFQTGDGDETRNLDGFFLMEEAADRDGDAATSEGLFAFEGGATATDVSEGDRVRVVGTVVERFGLTTIEVREIRVEETGAVADLASLAVETELPDVEGREALEGMLVTVTEPLTFTESFDLENFGEATLSTDGPVYQYSQLNAPDAAGNAAYLEEVADRTILIEDGLNGRRGDGDPILQPDGEPFSFGDDVRMGQSVTGLTAIVDYGFGAYRLRVPGAESFELDPETNPATEAPEDVGSDYKVASLNVLNYFTTLDESGARTDNGSTPRGAESAEELARQTDKLVATLRGLDADVIGLTEIENDFAGDSFPIQTLVDGVNASYGFERYAFVDPGQEFVGDDAIAVAFLYDQTSTALVGEAAVLDSADFLDPLGDLTNGDAYNRAALAQTFQEIGTGGEFTASINHFKSKGSLTGAEADADQGDGAGNNNATRTETARLLAEWLETNPTGSDDDDVLILGDLNSYARETPITTLEDAGYTDLGRTFEGDDVYSYRFSGQIGTLDYALANEALLPQVTGATTWNVNSDTPVFFDYNLDGTFTGQERPTDQDLFDGTSPARGSDHDPVLVGLRLEDDRPLLILGTDGNDRLNGTAADEIVDAGGGRLDVVMGGGGSDRFVFTDTADRRDSLRILDFDVEDDVLDLAGATVTEVRVFGGNISLTLDDNRDNVILAGVTDFGQIAIENDGALLG